MSIRFVLALVEYDVLSAEQFVELTRARVAAQLPLATLALRSNVLTIRQVRDVLDEAETRQISFEQAALETSTLCHSQLEALAAQQEAAVPDWVELLLQQGLLTASQVHMLQQACAQAENAERTFAPPKPKFASQRSVEAVVCPS